jgi:peroxiredoxin
MDQEILGLNDLPANVRKQAIHNLALRIRQQPKSYAVALACNLALSASEASEPDTLEEVATVLTETLREAPPRYKFKLQYQTLAELSHYDHIRVSLDDPQYTAALAELRADDQQRKAASFTLRDMQGKRWSLTSLHGNIVLVNFWATWCAPCRREISDLESLHTRFGKRGLLVLGITDEEAGKVDSFRVRQKMRYPVLLDPGKSVQTSFRVDGIPASFVYDRDGCLVAQALGRPTMQAFLGMLAQAGLR